MKKRLFIISNRLPINIATIDHQVQVNNSSGGLVSAVDSYLNNANERGENQFSEIFWAGVPGCSQADWVEAKKSFSQSYYQFLPVFVNHRTYDLYYNGLSNSVIWALFHYFPSYAEYKSEYYESYIKANEDFCTEISRYAKEGDVIWIHDYHLLPLAGMIRTHFPNITIGFFLHIPFPSYELFRLMPDRWQYELLSGILGADLIGFHTVDYANHFINSLQMVLGIDAEVNVIKYKNRLVKIDVFPISIDFKKFNSAFNEKEIADLRTLYKQQFKNQKILFSVDRLDYTKGVFSRLKAYEWFLEHFPEYRERAIFIIVIVPSRDSIPKYAERKREIDEYIGNINSTIGTITWKPVIYQYTHLAFDQLIALYTACDMAIITPLRDGMNLVAKEFVASRQDLRGVLLLSEMAGAARELSEALLVNPNDIDGFADKIKDGLEMSTDEQARHLSVMQKRISDYNVNTWAEDFFTQLHNIKNRQREFEFMFLDHQTKMLIYEQYQAAHKRLLLLDYDGTLVSFSADPQKAVPDNSLLMLLTRLCENKKNHIYIISGRDSKTLEKWFGHLPVNLVAEHGAKMKSGNGIWETDKHIITDENWRPIIYRILEIYVKRCANSFIEEKEYSIVWHYRNAEPTQAKMRANELYNEVCQVARSLNIMVTPGNKIIEIRTKGIDKGTIAKRLLKEKKYDFILACGDDSTDEDMFKILAKVSQACTIKIGDAASYAKYNLYTPQMMVSMLSYLESITA